MGMSLNDMRLDECPSCPNVGDLDLSPGVSYHNELNGLWLTVFTALPEIREHRCWDDPDDMVVQRWSGSEYSSFLRTQAQQRISPLKTLS
jgi:hypothetical protein